MKINETEKRRVPYRRLCWKVNIIRFYKLILLILFAILTFSVSAQEKYTNYCKIFVDSIKETENYKFRTIVPIAVPEFLEITKIHKSGCDGDFYRYIEIRYKNNNGYILFYDGMDKYSINDQYCFLYKQITDTSDIINIIKEANNNMIFDSLLFWRGNPNFTQTTATREDELQVNIQFYNNLSYYKRFNYVSDASCGLMMEFDNYIDFCFPYRTFKKLDCEKANEILSEFHSNVAINYIIAQKCDFKIEAWFKSIVDTTINSNYRNLLFSNLSNVRFGREEIIMNFLNQLIERDDINYIMKDIDYETICDGLKWFDSEINNRFYNKEKATEYIRKKRNSN